MGPQKQGFWPKINCSQMKLPNFVSPSGDSWSKSANFGLSKWKSLPNIFDFSPLSRTIPGQKSCFLGPTIFEISTTEMTLNYTVYSNELSIHFLGTYSFIGEYKSQDTLDQINSAWFHLLLYKLRIFGYT